MKYKSAIGWYSGLLGSDMFVAAMLDCGMIEGDKELKKLKIGKAVPKSTLVGYFKSPTVIDTHLKKHGNLRKVGKNVKVTSTGLNMVRARLARTAKLPASVEGIAEWREAFKTGKHPQVDMEPMK